MTKTLIINEFGSDLRLDHECLIIIDKEQNLKEKLPLQNLDSIMLYKGMTISTTLIQKLAQNEIPLYIQGDQTLPTVELHSIAYHRKNQLWIQQLHWVQSKEALETARNYIILKLEQQIITLKKFNRRVQVNFAQQIEQIQTLIEKLKSIEINILSISQIMGYEGAGANLYWHCLSQITPNTWHFTNRETYNAKDFFNLCLNYGYGIIKNHLKTICLKSSLHFDFGFLHQMNRQENLIYDLIEIIRPIIDYTLIIALKPIDEIKHNALDTVTKKIIAKAINKQLDTVIQTSPRKITWKQSLLENIYELANAIMQNQSQKPKI